MGVSVSDMSDLARNELASVIKGSWTLCIFQKGTSRCAVVTVVPSSTAARCEAAEERRVCMQVRAAGGAMLCVSDRSGYGASNEVRLVPTLAREEEFRLADDAGTHRDVSAL